jgi:hypothetical protein
LERGKTKEHYSLLVTHGSTANKKKYFGYAVEGVDAIITGHTHNAEVSKPAKIVFGQRSVTIRPIVSITATPWLAPGGYSLRKMYLPQTHSDPQYLLLDFTGSNAKRGSIRVVW